MLEVHFHAKDIAVCLTLQYEALGAPTPKRPEKSTTKQFRPAFAGSTAAFSPQPEYMACPAMRPVRAKVSAESSTATTAA